MSRDLHALLLSTFLGGGILVAGEIRVPLDHPSIQGALDAAGAGDTVLVSPGRYAERLVLKPGVILRSAGPDEPGELGLKRAEATIIDGAAVAGDHPGVQMAEGATLDGFTVTGTGTYDEAVWQRNWDEHGEHQDHAHIGESGTPGIAITGISCSVLHNIVHHIGDTGIAIRGVQGKLCAPRITANVCYRNMGGGIGSMEGSTAIITDNVCFENFYAGIGHDNASPLVTGNACHHNIRAGIGISEGACPVVRGNECHGNRRAGIGIRTGPETRPVVEDNDCHGNDMAGIGCEEGAAPVIRNNHCHDNRLAGIGCRDDATPLILGNLCENNATAGIGIEGESRAILTGNTCRGNRLVAVGIPGGGDAILTGNHLSRSGGMPPIVAILKGSTAVLRGNEIEGGGVAGVLVDGEAVITGNTFQGGGGGSGIFVRGEGRAVLGGNRITGYKTDVNQMPGAVVIQGPAD